MRINWKRLLWVIFIYLYTGLFFYHCLQPFHNWPFSYIYTMLLIIWLGVEYYHKHLFFQSGFLPFELYKWQLRATFALFFYSSFIVGITTTIWWTKNQIGLYPFVQIIGIILLASSIYVRWKTIRANSITSTKIAQFYLSIALLIGSLALAYGSYFLVLYTVVIGCPLVFFQYTSETSVFRDFIHTQNITKIESKQHETLWKKYLEKKLKKKRKG
jgi:hypothetical protein